MFNICIRTVISPFIATRHSGGDGGAAVRPRAGAVTFRFDFATGVGAGGVFFFAIVRSSSLGVVRQYD
jgi:hypothetical protein